MKIRSAELKTVCGFTSQLPEPDLPEIAFAGRSNVGKSSLINALMQRKRLARVGETPGKTRTVNFYEIDALIKRYDPEDAQPDPDAGQEAAAAEDGKTGLAVAREESERFCLVDLPGYGYANVSRAEKERWGRLIERYLSAPRDLRAVFLLLDIRHEPNANDRQMYEWILRSGRTPVLIATKADKIKRSKVNAQLKVLRESLKAPKEIPLLPFSALSRSGREEICEKISELL